MKKEDIKNWFEENGKTIITGVVSASVAAVIVGLGYSGKIKRLDAMLTILNEKGMMKFFHPETMAEITVKELANIDGIEKYLV